MTREEAIEAIKCNLPDSRYTILREALDMAISALRQQECVGDVNKSLTLDELREMGVEPYYHVSLQRDRVNHWAVLDPFVAEHIEAYHYGERWLAYRQKPEEGTV